MRQRFSPSHAVRLLLPLCLACAALGQQQELPVPRATLTFDSYYQSPRFRPVRPVYVSEVDVVSYVPDTIVTLADRKVRGL